MANPIDLEKALSGKKNLAGVDLSGTDLRGIAFRGAELYKADFRYSSLSGADFRSANLIGANFSGADLLKANLLGADLRGANLKLIQVTGKPVNLSGLPQALLEHVETSRFMQGDWDCGAHCGLAGRAAEYIGLPGNSGAGVIAILEAMPGFDVEVLYQASPGVAIAELKRAIGDLPAKDTQANPDSFLVMLSKKYNELGKQCTQLKADVENASKHVTDLQSRLNKASICQGAISDLIGSLKELEADTTTTSQGSDPGIDSPASGWT